VGRTLIDCSVSSGRSSKTWAIADHDTSGIINGGLGIRLASFSPFRSDSQTKTAGIVYGVVAGVMFALYAILVILFEMRRRSAQRQPTTTMQQTKDLPTYEESQSSSTSVASRQNTGPNAGAPTDSGVRYS
jgi:hypothetical protein